MSEMSLMYNNPHYFYGHGKLLLTGEYFVLDGALSLALPTTMGQSLSIKYKSSFDPKLIWKSYDVNGKCWFEATFDLWRFKTADDNTSPESLFLQKVLLQARKQNPHFLRDEVDVTVETRLEFPLEWGLGSSSTLIYNIAQWAYVSPFELLFKTTGGSGYDIACAQSMGPILYEKKGSSPVWSEVRFDPEFKEHLFFVYLGKKQNSEEGIRLYREKISAVQNELVVKLSSITREMMNAKTLEEFDFLLSGHEKIISQTLELPTAKEKHFADFWGQVKSLGAWGGDFVLVTSNKDHKTTKNYFLEKGFDVVIPYSQMVRDPKIETRPEGSLLQ
ncbi:MAG: GYDIA family GHMP kinase [Bacteriovoracaceae bacterium]